MSLAKETQQLENDGLSGLRWGCARGVRNLMRKWSAKASFSLEGLASRIADHFYIDNFTDNCARRYLAATKQQRERYDSVSRRERGGGGPS